MTNVEQVEKILRDEWLNISLYVWGGNGQLVESFENFAAFEAWVRKMEVADSSHTKEVNVQRILNRCRALQAAGVTHIRIGDCSGTFYSVFKQMGIGQGDMSAASMYSRCTHIDKSQLQPGDLLFRFNGSKISHVGIYLGGTTVIENNSRDKGVVITKLNRKLSSGELYWNRFGIWAGMRDTASSTQPENPVAPKERVEDLKRIGFIVVDKIKKSCNVRSGPSMSYAIVGEAAKGDDYPLFAELAEPGTKWKWFKINYDGVVGYIRTDLASSVSAVPTSSAGTGDTMRVTADNVNIRTGPSTDYPVITTLDSGAIYPYLGETTADGWIKFEYEDVEAYISGQFAEVV